jgi:hypothetical protein
MSEFTTTKRGTGHLATRVPAWLAQAGACSVLVAGVFGCGASKPPPHVVEVPIDQFSAAAGPAPADAPGATPENPAVEPAATSTAPGAAGGAAPTPLPGNSNSTPTASGPPPALPPFPAPGTHARPAKAARLNSVDCARLSDRYFIVAGISQGLTTSQATKASPGMRTTAQEDPAFAAGETSCISQSSRKQYVCAMKSTTPDAWKACLE